MLGFQAAGAAPLVHGHPVDEPRDGRQRDPHRQPGALGGGDGRDDRLGRHASPRSATTRSSTRGASWPPARASSASRRAPPRWPGCSSTARGDAERIVCVLTGHGLKDPRTALDHAGAVVPCEPDLDSGRARGSRVVPCPDARIRRDPGGPGALRRPRRGDRRRQAGAAGHPARGRQRDHRRLLRVHRHADRADLGHDRRALRLADRGAQRRRRAEHRARSRRAPSRSSSTASTATAATARPHTVKQVVVASDYGIQGGGGNDISLLELTDASKAPPIKIAARRRARDLEDRRAGHDRRLRHDGGERRRPPTRCSARGSRSAPTTSARRPTPTARSTPATMLCAGFPAGGTDTLPGRLRRPAARAHEARAPAPRRRHQLRRGLRAPGKPGIYARVAEGPLRDFVKQVVPAALAPEPKPRKPKHKKKRKHRRGAAHHRAAAR